MLSKTHRCLSIILVLALVCHMLTGCSVKRDCLPISSGVKQESIVAEQQIYEQFISEEKIQEKYIRENLIYEDGIYEYQIHEGFYSEAYVFEMTVGELTEEEILANLPEEIQEYDINWAKVIAKFAVGTTIIVAVGVVHHLLKGATYFVFSSASSVAKEALIGGAIGATVSEVISTLQKDKMPAKGVTKYAIEGFADGYMWGAIASVLKISKENLTRLKAFKTATGGSLSINPIGRVFDETGKAVGKAVYANAKGGIWYLIDEASTVVQVFDKAGKAITDAAILATLKSLPKNAILRLGTAADAVLCYTDDAGQIIRMGNELVPNLKYTLSGYTYYTDELGRITKVTFDELRLKPEGQARKIISDGKNIIGHGYELATDDRGHLIADMFEGNSSLANIVAQDGSVNKGEVKAIETAWKNCLKQGGGVKGSIQLTYSGESFRPDNFEYIYDMGEGVIDTLIPNIQ